ncbi:hypothetical protein CYLTODRAFT_458752 [Cylindrobasidium torrendii FP15055 ss-10]|uniref:Uncharacterized protein n=1 Tax=Cylindrobasidium torrendii FP15055 ss-10 TaxID=1314674 RepID=A0A0D7AZM2_9AGAR|nr:hypothetical protein CYLTODRAFT_458752 [Cylindrobasidium torrendii FP15055 ss-10]
MYSESDSHISFFNQHEHSDRCSLVHGLVDACTASLSTPESGPRRCWRFYAGLRDVLKTSVIYLDSLVNTRPDFFTASLRFVTSPLGPSNDARLDAVGKAAAHCTCPNDGNLWAHQPFEEGKFIDSAHCAEQIYAALTWISLAGVSKISVESDGTFSFETRVTSFDDLEYYAKKRYELTGYLPWPRNRADVFPKSPLGIVETLWYCFHKFNPTNRGYSLSLLSYFLLIDDSCPHQLIRNLGLMPDFPTQAMDHIQLIIDCHMKDGAKTLSESDTHATEFLTILWMFIGVANTIVSATDKSDVSAMKEIWMEHARDIICAMSHCLEIYGESGGWEAQPWFMEYRTRSLEDMTIDVAVCLLHMCDNRWGAPLYSRRDFMRLHEKIRAQIR